jgi:glucan 1,3-beta-glucosidase
MKRALSLLLPLMTVGYATAHIQSQIRSGAVPCRGVNIGGWLVAEHWMSQTSVIWDGVPDNIANGGEHKVMEYWGHNNGDWRFEQHRNQWITEDDIKEMASYGINCVRVPVGFWIMGTDPTGGNDW